MVLVSECGEQIHSRIRLTNHQCLNVITGNFEADGFFEGSRIRLMRSLLKHGGETEEFAGPGLIDDDLLVIFVDGGDADLARYGDVSQANISGFVDALPGDIGLEINLRGKDGDFVVVEKGEEGNGFEEFWFAAHGVLRCRGMVGSLSADFI